MSSFVTSLYQHFPGVKNSQRVKLHVMGQMILLVYYIISVVKMSNISNQDIMKPVGTILCSVFLFVYNANHKHGPELQKNIPLPPLFFVDSFLQSKFQLWFSHSSYLHRTWTSFQNINWTYSAYILSRVEIISDIKKTYFFNFV